MMDSRETQNPGLKSKETELENRNSGDREDDAKTMSQMLIGQFLSHRMAVVGVGVIVFFVVVALSAPLIAHWTGLDPNQQNVFHRYQPPLTSITLAKSDQEQAIEKFINDSSQVAAALGTQVRQAGLVPAQGDPEETLFTLATQLEVDQLKSALVNLKTTEAKAFLKVVRGFQVFHLLGTDELGRDVLMRLIYGTRVSIGVGLMVAFVGAALGLLIGSLAGYYGGLFDTILMRITDSLLAIPQIPILIIFAAVDLKQLAFFRFVISSENESVTKLIAILCLFSWMTVARLVRGSILSLKEREFILAAKTLGARDRTIILTHMVPNVVAPLLVAVTLNIGNSILSEAALSFLGLGIQPPTPSWGNMLFNAQELISEAPLLAILPGLLIFVVVISFNFVGDGLQDAADPKAIRR